VKITDVPRASGEQSREVIDQMLDDLQALVDEFNETLPFANEWAAMNRLRLELTDTLRMIEKSLGMWEVTRNGVRVMSIELPSGHPSKEAEESAKSTMAQLKAEDDARPAEWSYGPVEFYVDEEDDEDEERE
jgi:hypothetical protein